MNVENMFVLFLGDCRPADFGVIKCEGIAKIQKEYGWAGTVTGQTKREGQRKVKRHTACRNQIKRERDSPSCDKKEAHGPS